MSTDNRAIPQKKPYVDPHLSIGQIRRIEGVGQDAILIVISRVNAISDTCDVILLDHNIANATSRDFITNFEKETFKFGYLIMCDYVGNVSSKVLRESLVYGNSCQFCVASIGQTAFNLAPDMYELPFEHDCYQPGEFSLKILSDEWVTRNQLFAEFFESCNQFLDYQEFIAKLEASSFYYKYNSISGLVKSKPEEISLIDIKDSIKSNRYARMLVRG